MIVFAREVVRAVGEASLEAGVAVRVDQRGMTVLPGEIDAGRAAGAVTLALPADRVISAVLDEERRIGHGLRCRRRE